MIDLSEKMMRQGHVIYPRLLSAPFLALSREYMDLAHRSGRMSLSENEVVSGQFEQYGALLSETFLLRLCSTVEAVVDAKLIPSYSYWRIYQHGAVLKEHRDRAACEIGVSVAIDVEPRRLIWPLCVRDKEGREQAVALKPGDALIYLGTQLPRWRPPFEGEVQYQMFLHYVRRDGPNAKWAYDGRDACGMVNTKAESLLNSKTLAPGSRLTFAQTRGTRVRK